MLNRLQINPLEMGDEENSILAHYLQGVSAECRISHRHRHFRVGKPVFWLSHDIVVRQKAPGIWRYYVVELNDIGSGRYGAVFKRIGRLHFDPFDSSRIIVKRYPEYSRLYKKQKYLADTEYSNMLHFPHLLTREYLPGYPNFISMRHFDGIDLFKLIEDDFNGLSTLLLSARYRMPLILLRALQDQVADWMMLHRDIKPNNIIYNPATNEAYIIDMGNSQAIGSWFDKRSNGNSRYSAPEVFTSKEHDMPVTLNEYLAHAPTTNKSTIKSDLYSMALVISLIWRNSDPLLFGECGGVKRRMQIRAANKWKRAFKLFNDIGDEVIDDADAIEAQLNAMTHPDPGKRPDLQQSIKFFDTLCLEYRLRDFAGDKLAFRFAHKRGLDCYAEMRRIKRAEALHRSLLPILSDLKFHYSGTLHDLLHRLSKKYLYKYSHLYHQLKNYVDEYEVPNHSTLIDFIKHLQDFGSDDALRSCIKQFLSDVADDANCIAEFIETAGIQCLEGINSMEQLLLQVDAVFDQFTENYQKITVGYAFVKDLLQQERKSGASNEERLRVLSMLVADLDYFSRSTRDKPMTIDWLYSINQHCINKHAKVAAILGKLTAQQEQQAVNDLNI